MIIKRRKTRKVKIGSIYIGGNAPIAIQSMAKTDTKNIKATVTQIKKLEEAGCEIGRVAVRDREAAHALKDIKKKIKIPLVADIHFNPELAILAIKNGVDKIRINPGNIRDKKALIQIVKFAKQAKIPIRIGLNSGSVPKGKNMLDLAKETIKLFEQYNFHDIIISLKASDVLETISLYRKMANLCDYPFHLGITATGLPEEGIIKSSIGIGSLLLEGIGDTIRVSLTADPVDEVKVAKAILSSLKIRNFGPEIISCPTCGRCGVDLVRIVRELNNKLLRLPFTVYRLPSKRYGTRYTVHGTRKAPFKIAVMGCEVNGPGEAKDSDIGIAAGKKNGVLFKKGKIIKRLKEKDFVDTLVKEIRKGTNYHG